MTKKQSSPYALAAMLGITVFAFTILFSMTFWMDEIEAAAESIPRIYYIAFIALWIGASAFAFLRGSEGTRELGFVGLFAMIFSVGVTAIFAIPEYLTPILKAQLPTWPPYLWAVFGVGTAISLLAIGFAGLFLKGAHKSWEGDDGVSQRD